MYMTTADAKSSPFQRIPGWRMAPNIPYDTGTSANETYETR